jgi:hypothetical protein
MDENTKKKTAKATYKCRDCNEQKNNGTQIKYQDPYFIKKYNEWDNDNITWIQDLCKPCGVVRLTS